MIPFPRTTRSWGRNAWRTPKNVCVGSYFRGRCHKITDVCMDVSRVTYDTTRAFQECGQNREQSRYINYALRKSRFHHPMVAMERFKSSYVWTDFSLAMILLPWCIVCFTCNLRCVFLSFELIKFNTAASSFLSPTKIWSTAHPGQRKRHFEMDSRFFNLCRVFPFRWKWKMQANFLGVDFLGIALTFRESGYCSCLSFSKHVWRNPKAESSKSQSRGDDLSLLSSFYWFVAFIHDKYLKFSLKKKPIVEALFMGTF